MNTEIKLELPTPLTNPDFSEIKEAIDEHIERVMEYGEWVSQDTLHYVFDNAIRAIYGDQVFEDLKKLQNNKTTPKPKKGLTPVQESFITGLQRFSQENLLTKKKSQSDTDGPIQIHDANT